MLYTTNDSKPDFDAAERLARELRLMQPNDDFALDVLKMDFDREIYFETFENYAKLVGISADELTNFGQIKDGYTVKHKNAYIIFYYEAPFISPRLNWTLAHEIGHIYLNHSEDGEIEEIEAHWFAAELLMPIPIILNLCRKIHVDNYVLEDLFCVSFEASLKRIDSLNRMCAFSTYLQDDFNYKYNGRIQGIVNKTPQKTKII